MDKLCLCAPEYEAGAEGTACSRVIHNAWDGREKAERDWAGIQFQDDASGTLDWFQSMR